MRIGEEGRRLRKVVEDLLWLARSDGRIPDRVSGHACDLGEVVGRSAERFRAVCERQDITLEVDGPARARPPSSARRTRTPTVSPACWSTTPVGTPAPAAG